MVYHLVTVKPLAIHNKVYEIAFIYYKTLIDDLFDPYKVDVLIPRRLECLLSKSELLPYLQPFLTKRSVFSAEVLKYCHFDCPLGGVFLITDHPKFKGLSAHEYYSGIPLKDI